MPNYALEALRGYQGIDNIYRQNQRDERESDIYNRALTKENAGMEAKRLQTQGLMESLPPEEQQQPEDRSIVAQSFQKHMTDNWGFSPEQSAQAMGRVQHLVNDPNQAGEALALSDKVAESMNSGSLPDRKDIVRLVNIMETPSLTKRGAPHNLGLSVNDVIPSPTGNLMFDLSAKKLDTGETYNAPATTGKSPNKGDDVVQEYAIKDVLKWFGGSRATLKALLEAEAKAGLSTTADKYQEYVREQQKRGEHIQDAVASKRALSGEDDYATDGKRIVTLNDFKNLSPDQQAKFMPLKQQEINMKQEQLGLARSAANKPSEFDRKVSQIGIMVKNNELTPEEGKAAMMGIYGIRPKGEMSEAAAMGLALRQDAAERTKREDIGKKEERRAALIDKSGGVNEQNIAEVNAITKALGEPLYVPVVTPGEKHFIGRDEPDTTKYVQETSGSKAEGIGRPQGDPQPSGEGVAPSASQTEGGKKAQDQRPDPQKVLAGIPEGKPFTQAGKRYQKVDGKVVEITGQDSAPQASPQQTQQPAQQPAPVRQQQAPSGMDRLAELDKMRGSRGNIVSSAGIGEIAGAAKGAYGAVKDSGALVNDVYQSLVGEPFMNALRSAKTSQEKQAANFTIDQRYKNGVISKEEYIAAFDIINK